MEFVLVTFPTLRPVRMDGAQEGQTGQIIGVQRGTHIFDLGSPQDYSPPSVQTVVAATSQMQPLVIPFQPVALPVAVAPPPGAPAAAPPMSRRGPARPPAKRAAARKKSAGRKKSAPRKMSAGRKKTASTKRKATSARSSRSKKARGGRKKTR